MPRKTIFAEIALIAAMLAGGQHCPTPVFFGSAAAAPGLAVYLETSPRWQEHIGEKLQFAQSRPVDPDRPPGGARQRPVDPDTQGGARMRTGPADPIAQGGASQRLEPDVVAKDPVEHAAPPLTPQVPRVNSLPGYRVVGVDANDVLNIRSGPDANSAIVGTIPPNGRNVRMIGSCAGSWCPIEYRGTQGWANRRFLMGE